MRKGMDEFPFNTDQQSNAIITIHILNKCQCIDFNTTRVVHLINLCTSHYSPANSNYKIL